VGVKEVLYSLDSLRKTFTALPLGLRRTDKVVVLILYSN
jgi:hypothetical protein